jgi:hypothetical protein
MSPPAPEDRELSFLFHTDGEVSTYSGHLGPGVAVIRIDQSCALLSFCWQTPRNALVLCRQHIWAAHGEMCENRKFRKTLVCSLGHTEEEAGFTGSALTGLIRHFVHIYSLRRRGFFLLLQCVCFLDNDTSITPKLF